MKTKPTNVPLIKRVIAYINKGYAVSQIIKWLNVSEATVAYWKRQHNARHETSVPIDSNLIRTKQYSKMTVEQLRVQEQRHRQNKK
jgi:transposase-like protein